MRVTTSPPGETVGFDGLRAVVGAGEDVVGRFPGIVCVASCPEPGPLREFLTLCASVGGPDPGRALARRLATWMSGPSAPGPGLRFGTVAAAGDQLAVYLVGAVEARVDGLGGLTLSGAHAAIGTDRLFPLPRTPVVLSLDGGQVRADPADVHDLRAGVVPGAAVVLHPPTFDLDERDAADGAALAGHEWFEAGGLSVDPLGDQPPWSSDLPVQRTSGRNGANHPPVVAGEFSDPAGDPGPDREVEAADVADLAADPLNGDAGRHSLFGETDPTPAEPPSLNGRSDEAVADPDLHLTPRAPHDIDALSADPLAAPAPVRDRGTRADEGPGSIAVDDDPPVDDPGATSPADRDTDWLDGPTTSGAAAPHAERGIADRTTDSLAQRGGRPVIDGGSTADARGVDRRARPVDRRALDPRTGDPPAGADGSDLWAVEPRAADRPDDGPSANGDWSAFGADPLGGRFPDGPKTPGNGDGGGTRGADSAVEASTGAEVHPDHVDLWAGDRRGASSTDLRGAERPSDRVRPHSGDDQVADAADDLFAAPTQAAEPPSGRGRRADKPTDDTVGADIPSAPQAGADSLFAVGPRADRRSDAEPVDRPPQPRPKPGPRRTDRLELPPSRSPDVDRGAGPSAVEATSTMPGLLFHSGASTTAVPDVRPSSPPVPAAAPEPGRGGGARIRGYRCENGHLNDPRSPTCRQCGATIDERAGGLVAGPRPALGLVVFDDGAAHVVDGGYLVGRMPEVDDRVRSGELRPIVVEDRAGSVSRVHAEIRVSGWDVIVVDTGSRNGTYVCGPDESAWTELPPRRSRRLQPGARVRLGARVFVFESSSTVR